MDGLARPMIVGERHKPAKPVEASPQREAGFNYGQPLPYDPLNPVIADGTLICNRLRAAAQAASALSWEMEMATRAYRIAETVEERERAAVKLAALTTEHKRVVIFDDGVLEVSKPMPGDEMFE